MPGSWAQFRPNEQNLLPRAGSLAAAPRLVQGLDQSHRYNAACAAVLAAGGKGVGADKLDAAEKAGLRGQALDWLSASLAVISKFLTEYPEEAGEVEKGMRHWLNDPELSGVRDAKELAGLPEAERQRCAKLWGDVRDLLRRAAKK